MLSSKDTSKKTLQKKTVKRLYDTTQKCFNLAMEDIAQRHKMPYDELATGIENMRYSRLLTFFTQSVELPANIHQIKEEIDIRYRELLCTLKTKDIEDIILADDLGLASRAEITIQTLTDELVRRSLMSDKPKLDPRIYAKN